MDTPYCRLQQQCLTAGAAQIRILEDEGEKGLDGVGQHDDQFLKKIESTLLSQVKLQGIPNIKKVGSLSRCW